VKLLHRTTRSVQLTADGAAYYPRVVRLLADLEDADAASPAPWLRPGAAAGGCAQPAGQPGLIPALPAFHAQYPDIQLHLGVSDRVVDIVSDQVDCVVRGGTVTNPSLIARHVGDLALRVYAAPSYLQRCGVPQHPTELEGPHHHTVGFVGPHRQAPALAMRRGHEQVQAQGRYVCAVDDGNAYLAAGLAGLGVLWLPDYMAKPHVAAGTLVPLFADWQMDPCPCTSPAPHRHVSAKLRVFIDWVAALMAEHAPL
jgi:DNA-binding transcriptional LysR family regulator